MLCRKKGSIGNSSFGHEVFPSFTKWRVNSEVRMKFPIHDGRNGIGEFLIDMLTKHTSNK
jgi:hypothetical protein